RRLSRPARQVWRSGKAFASTGAERTKVREHPRAAKTKPKPKIAARAGSLRYRGWPAITLPQPIDDVTGRIRCFKTCIALSGGRPRADGWFRALLTHDFAIRAAHCNRSEARSPAVDTTTKLSRWHAVDACRKPFADAIETDENISPGTALR